MMGKSIRLRKFLNAFIVGMIILIIAFPGWFAGEMPVLYKNNEGLFILNITKANSISQNRKLSNVHIILNPIIPFHPTHADLEEGRFIKPLSYGQSGNLHIMGTDHLGRDVLSGIIWGARNSLLIAFVAIFISFVISYLLGGISGYFGDSNLLTDWSKLISFLLALGAIFIFFQWNSYGLGGFWKWLLLFFSMALLLIIFFMPMRGAKFRIKIDTYLSTFINIFDSLPALIVAIVFFLTYSKVNILSLALLIGILKVPTFYRIIRSEVRRVREKPYIQSAKISGKGWANVLFKEMLPNILPAIITYGLYAMAAVIIIESTISFLNLGGVNTNYISWGKQLSLSRNYINEWWLAVFPGLCIFVVIIFLRQKAKKLSLKSNHEF